ncbi:helix-turn-helix transcriptional regulator [Isoptericola sp. NPDC055881]
MSELMFKAEVAEMLRVSEATLTDWVYRGEGIGALSVKLGRRRVWRRADVEKALDQMFTDAARKASA